MTDHQAHKVEAEINVRGTPQWWSTVAIVVSVILVGVGCVLYARHAADVAVKQSEQKLCPIVSFNNEFYKANPPNPKEPLYEVRLKGAQLMQDLRREYHCK